MSTQQIPVNTIRELKESTEPVPFYEALRKALKKRKTDVNLVCPPADPVARRILGSDEDADDAVQEAFLSAFKAIGSFAGQSRLSTWLHRIVVNAALMKRRSQRRSPERPIDDLLPKFLADGHQAEPAVSWQQTTEDAVASRETRNVVRRSIDRLPETYRTILLLRDIEELNTEETAQLLGININAVKTRLHRARTRHEPGLINGPSVARRGIGHQLAVGRIVGKIVELCYGAHPRGKGRVSCHIGNSLAVQKHRAAITQTTHVFVTAPSHTDSLLPPWRRDPRQILAWYFQRASAKHDAPPGRL